jgi:hypothetical protein
MDYTPQAVEDKIRMNFSQDAKGYVKMDLTVKFDTVEECEANSLLAIESYKRICAIAGLKLLPSPQA